ncbi:MAG TPA: hypothetical protein VHU15_13310 [Stellaceae bacterium]|jgi:hypothetical protein|nr:hypothetical protein [Stellaceae bacterium]
MVEFRRTEDASGFGDAIATTWLRDAQAWTGLQCELLSGIEALWAECARRQSEAMETSARTLQGVFNGRHIVEIAQLQRDWLASAARRTAHAADRWAGDSVAWTREMAAGAERSAMAANESVATASAERQAAE